MRTYRIKGCNPALQGLLIWHGRYVLAAWMPCLFMSLTLHRLLGYVSRWYHYLVRHINCPSSGCLRILTKMVVLLDRS